MPHQPTSVCRCVWDDYEADTELIGRGAFARVFRAIQRDNGSHVAIKVIGRETKAFAQQRRGERVNQQEQKQEQKQEQEQKQGQEHHLQGVPHQVV